MPQLSWVAVDWGTSNVRAWMMAPDGTVISRARSDRGMSRLEPNEFEAALLQLVGNHLPRDGRTPIVCCGVAGASQGWFEAPYVTAPCIALAADA